MLEKNVTAQEKYNRLIAQANQLNKDGALTGEELTKVMAGAAEEFSRQSQAISGITTAIGNAFSDAILNGKSFNDVLSGLARTIAEVIIKTQVVLPLVKALNQAAGNIFGPGSGINGASVSGSGTTAGGEGAVAYAVLPNARGNVYDGSNVLPFARGGVVTNPKFFPMSTGRGLMGEAGPEAVMPLRRGPDGKLGVAATTSGGGTQVNVYNQNGGEVETKERSTPGGGKVIDIYIKKAVADGIASGQFDKAMGSTYGLRRQGAR
jgi:lambda family phage tail tape measure protein